MKILYLSNSKLSHSVNTVYIKGLRESGVDVHKVRLNKADFFSVREEYEQNGRDVDIMMVGYDSPWLAIWLRVLSHKPIIYNALCSRYERIIVSRGLASRLSPKAFYYWLSDFLAVRASSLVMLETDAQIRYFKKLFGGGNDKYFQAWTGVDERKFFYDPSVGKPSEFTVVFRGSLLPEAGVEYAVYAAKKLEGDNIRFVMHVGGQEIDKLKRLVKELRPKNLKLTTDYLSDSELRILMQKAHLSLGQLSRHERLERTIPHKMYESLALRLPYLTAGNNGVLELLNPNDTCIVCRPSNADSLAEKILWAKKHSEELERIAENGYRLYKDRLQSKLLAQRLLNKYQKRTKNR